MENIDSLDLVLAGEGVDADLRRRGAEGVVVEGTTLTDVAVVVDQWGGVEPLLGERDAIEIGFLDQFAQGMRRSLSPWPATR